MSDIQEAAKHNFKNCMHEDQSEISNEDNVIQLHSDYCTAHYHSEVAEYNVIQDYSDECVTDIQYELLKEKDTQNNSEIQSASAENEKDTTNCEAAIKFAVAEDEESAKNCVAAVQSAEDEKDAYDSKNCDSTVQSAIAEDEKHKQHNTQSCEFVVTGNEKATQCDIKSFEVALLFQLAEFELGMKKWLKLHGNPSTLMLTVMNDVALLQLLLNGPVLTEITFLIIMISLESLYSKAQCYMHSFTKLLEVLVHSKFYDYHIINYLTKNDEWSGGVVDLSLLYIKETYNKLPFYAYKCSNLLQMMKTKYDHQELKCNVDILEKAWNSCYYATKIIRLRTSQYTLSAWSDDTCPPFDFKKLSIIPTEHDFLNSPPFLRFNKTSGQYQNANHYLDVNFRLLHQDLIHPLRNLINKFKNNHLSFHEERKWISRNVKIIGMCIFGDINHLLLLDKSNYLTKKKFKGGTMVCLSKDNFNTKLYGTVSYFENDKQDAQTVKVKFHNGFDEVYGALTNEAYVMIENPAYFESYRHVLEALKKMDIKVLPMEKYIVRCDKDIAAIPLLEDKCYDLSCLLLNNYGFMVPVKVLLFDIWPDISEVCLNQEQYMAVKAALTKELTLIQGPPGTGKSYVGINIMKTLLQNTISPILVVGYSNHAVDQFLEAILPYCSKLVRMGGRSRSVQLKPYTLREYRREQRLNLPHLDGLYMLSPRIDMVREKVKSLLEDIQMISFDIVPQEKLKKYISYPHYSQLQYFSSCEWLESKQYGFENYLKLVLERHIIELLLQEKETFPDTKLNFSLPISAARKAKVHCYWRKKFEVLRGTLTVGFFFHEPFLTLVMHPAVYNSIQQTSQSLKDWLIGSNINEMLETIDNIQNAKCQKLPDGEQDSDNELDNYQENDFIEENNIFNDNIYNVHNESIERGNHRWTKLELFERCNLLGIKISQEVEFPELWLSNPEASTFHKLMKILKPDFPEMNEAEEIAIINIWQLSINDKYRLYKRWINKYRKDLHSEIKYLTDEYEKLLEKKRYFMDNQDACILKHIKVIGMTTTGAAKFHNVLSLVRPQIVVVEEAAEVLEAHIVTALNRDCKHLILIGDHQQLRPKTVVYDLANDFGLDVSLFERLVLNSISCVQLREQHRMRPEISKYMRHIYPYLEDSESVKDRPHILGMDKDVFFINHEELEEGCMSSSSKTNLYEAIYLIKLSEYLVLQGYSITDITILATYAKQVSLIAELKQQNSLINEIQVTTVDNFQGEQNKIILLSLTRSNLKKKVGFLKTDNRICVALSRAQYGMYVIGNIDFLAQHSRLIARIKDTALANEEYGQVLKLKCQRHCRLTFIKSALDFNQLYSCQCIRGCDSLSLHTEAFIILSNSLQLTSGHYCPEKCPNGHFCEWHSTEKCPPCPILVRILRPCEHDMVIPCWQFAEKKSSVCLEECNKFCSSGHKCKAKCIENCPLCIEILDCGHMCNRKPFLNEKPLNPKGCENPCELACEDGHNAQYCCMDKSHSFCTFVLSCGHQCEKQCGTAKDAQGPDVVRAGLCLKDCQSMCPRGLHHCSGKCFESCPPCSEFILYKLQCGHDVYTACHKVMLDFELCSSCHILYSDACNISLAEIMSDLNNIITSCIDPLEVMIDHCNFDADNSPGISNQTDNEQTTNTNKIADPDEKSERDLSCKMMQ